MCSTNSLFCVCLPDRTEQGVESKFTAVPLGGMCVQCIVVTQRIQHTYLMLLKVSGLHCLSSPYVFILCARIFLHTNTRIQSLNLLTILT